MMTLKEAKKVFSTADDLSSEHKDAYGVLFEHYCFDTGEMPYGTAKARTGDPYVWIADRLKAEKKAGRTGLLSVVEDYRAARVYGNIKLAKELKKTIKKDCGKFGLSFSEICGSKERTE